MKIKQIELDIIAENPFANCKLGREKYANTLTQIVGNYKDGFVLAINNEWGTGKTTFVKMWQQKLNLQGFKTIYFNAWENDFDANPLSALMAELKSLTNTKTKKAFSALVKQGSVLMNSVIPKLVKAIAAKYIDIEIAVDAIEDLSKNATDALQEEINNYSKRKEGLVEFKKSLTKFIEDSNEENPIIFIIDELDRCRPNYAVEVLEQIKHFFSVPGIVFVLSIDKTQLSHAVRGVYGSENINAEEYLRRFIDIEYSIPEPETYNYCVFMFDYYDFSSFFTEIRNKYQDFQYDKEMLLRVASALFKNSKLTLRQQEKMLIHFRVGLIFFKENQFIFPSLFLILIFAKKFHNEFYEKLKLKIFTPQELINKFSVMIHRNNDEDEIRDFIYVESLFVFLYNNSLPSPKQKLYKKDEQTGENITILESRFDKSDKHTLFFRFFETFHFSKFSSTKLEYLLVKIDLLEKVPV